MDRKLNILSNIVDDGGCGYFRVRWPFEAIKRSGLANTLIMETNWDETVMLKNIREADVIVSRPRTETFIWKLKSYIENDAQIAEGLNLRQKKFVFDHDDNTFDISPLNDHYKELGCEEVKITNPKTGKKEYLWKDGVDGFDLEGNRTWRDSLIKVLRDSDMVTTTTPHLANFFKQFNDNVVVLPNSIDFTKYRALEFKDDGWIRIGWQGGASHFEDWAEVNDAMVELFKKYDNIKLTILGSKWDGALKGIPEDRIEFYPWVKTIAHPYNLATLKIDIGIIPLKDMPFNHYKSELKFTEFSALKIPSVVRNILPYSPVCKDGDNALCYNNNRELVQKLSNLIENKRLRKKIAENAYKWAKENRDLDKNAHLWTEAYASLYSGIQKGSPIRIIT